MSNQVRDAQAPAWGVAVEADVPIACADLYDRLARPSRHPEVDGGGTVQAQVGGPDVLTERGQRFTMQMQQGLPYKATMVVTEVVPGRVVEWMGPLRHRWRWDLTPIDDTRTHVVESYLYADSALRWVFQQFLAEGARETMRRTLAQLR